MKFIKEFVEFRDDKIQLVVDILNGIGLSFRYMTYDDSTLLRVIIDFIDMEDNDLVIFFRDKLIDVDLKSTDFIIRDCHLISNTHPVLKKISDHAGYVLHSYKKDQLPTTEDIIDEYLILDFYPKSIK